MTFNQVHNPESVLLFEEQFHIFTLILFQGAKILHLASSNVNL